jgi:hypothetical protein
MSAELVSLVETVLSSIACFSRGYVSQGNGLKANLIKLTIYIVYRIGKCLRYGLSQALVAISGIEVLSLF